jgi:antirestriction protein ArdC
MKNNQENTQENVQENIQVNNQENELYSNQKNNPEKNSEEKKQDVYTMVNDRIIKHLENGVVPWQQSWTEAGLPKNMVTGKNYRGINVWLLNTLNYQKNDFLTFKQIKDLGGYVKKGEKSQEVIYWKWIEKEDKETGKKERTPMLRYYRVFNIDQCAGIPKGKLIPNNERKNKPLETCEKIISEMPNRPDIRHKQHSAFYNKSEDFVNVPKMETFKSNDSYYATLFHELVHSTGHNQRLNRRELLESRGMRSDNYAKEELTAEMGASYLKSYAGIPIEKLENNAAYIQSWLKRLKENKRFIVHASAQAQRATDYILNIKPEEKELEVTENNIEKEVKAKEAIVPENLPKEKSDRSDQLKSIREKSKSPVVRTVEI